jgi:hypothetical protein
VRSRVPRGRFLGPRFRWLLLVDLPEPSHFLAPPPGVREFDLGDADAALLEDAIFCQQAFKVVADLQKRITKRPDVIEEFPG